MKITLDLSWIFPFFNSNFFLALITFFSVIAVIWVYKSQKKNEKTKAARIILMEITDCENLLDSIKTNGVNLINTRYFLATNSWNKYKHLFAKDLDERELKLVNNFYQACELLNVELKEAYNLPDLWKDKVKIILEKHVEFSVKSKTKKEYELKKKSLKFFEKDTYWWQPNAPKIQILERVKQVRYVSSTTAEERLKKIAK